MCPLPIANVPDLGQEETEVRCQETRFRPLGTRQLRLSSAPRHAVRCHLWVLCPDRCVSPRRCRDPMGNDHKQSTLAVRCTDDARFRHQTGGQRQRQSRRAGVHTIPCATPARIAIVCSCRRNPRTVCRSDSRSNSEALQGTTLVILKQELYNAP